MGICVSYDRVLELEDWIASSVCERFKEDGVVIPACLRKGVFTIGDLDNLDHNPSSTTAVDAFHGTGISLFQFPTKVDPDEDRPPLIISPSETSQHSLPDSYGLVPAVALTACAVHVPIQPVSTEESEPLSSCLNEAQSKEKKWIEHAPLTLVEKDDLSSDDALVWAAFHALQQPIIEDPPALSALLPLFYEKSATPAMIKHGLDIQRRAIKWINPGQIPVITFDQPLFALAKLVQWKWPDVYGESVHVVMMGGLHLEMALWNTLDVLEDSGWTTALTEAEVASSGTADSFLKVVHLTRTRHAHQITLLTLNKLQKEAFSQSESNESEVEWRNKHVPKSPTFMFWDFILRYESLILIFVRAHREKNFSLYVEVLEKLTPLFFCLRSCQLFTMGTCSHGLTENSAAFRHWMLSAPELARLKKQFEEQYFPDTDPDHPRNFQNHEQGYAAQKTFQKQVNSLVKTFQRMGNPFLDDFPELATLDSHNCVDTSVVQALYSLENTGIIRQYQDYVAKVLEGHTASIHEPIKKQSLALFKRSHIKATSKQGKKLKVLQNNVALFGQLYISMQSRDGDLEELFAHEIQSFPPSLSDLGKLHLPNTKSDLLNVLSSLYYLIHHQNYDCIVLDGAVIVHFLPTKAVSTFNEYADKVFIPYVNKQLQHSTRVDIVWDVYVTDSLKESTREKRGKGVRRKVSGQTKLPGNWINFLHDPSNKKELFTFLMSKVYESTFPPTKAVYATLGETVVSVGNNNPAMPSCNHEADTRLVVHIQHALEQGLKRIEVRTVDTDVIVILVGAFVALTRTQPLADIWIAFGMGKDYRFYSINAIFTTLGDSRSRALPVFHALTGCDTTSAFRGKGKKSAWQAWRAYEEVTETFQYLADHPFEHLNAESVHFRNIERLIVMLYDKTSPLSSVNETRKELFCHKNRSLDRIPPNKNALLQHAQQGIYQAGIWTTCTQM